MRKLVLFTVALVVVTAGNAQAESLSLECFGGWDFEESPSYWYLLDPYGIPLETGDWVYVAWVGPNGWYDHPQGLDGNIGYPGGDDVMVASGEVEYSLFYIVATTWAPEDSIHPWTGEAVYCRVFDGPQGSIASGNYYADTDLYTVQHMPCEYYCFQFPEPMWGPFWHPSVELMAFEAVGRDGQVLLEWTTATETDNLGFHLERSRDGLTFERITPAVISGAGSSEIENSYTYVDRGLVNGTTYYYNLISIDMDGLEEVANETPVAATPLAQVPAAFDLSQNSPNPFNAVTEIRYELPRDVAVSLRVYNVRGAEVATLVDAPQRAGAYAVRWDARDVASGVYFCRLQAGEFGKTVKMVLLR
jgi:hypothetical protein